MIMQVEETADENAAGAVVNTRASGAQQGAVGGSGDDDGQNDGGRDEPPENECSSDSDED